MSGDTRNVMILVNDHRFLADFVRLNEAWITHYFKLEDADRALAARPSHVIDDGGFIFTLKVDDEVVGACALFNDGDGVFQLARMAVSPPHQGQGYGQLLMQAALEQLQSIRASRVFLLTNKKLLAAISIYKKYGFVIISEEQHPVYARSDLVMEKFLQVGKVLP